LYDREQSCPFVGEEGGSRNYPRGSTAPTRLTRAALRELLGNVRIFVGLPRCDRPRIQVIHRNCGHLCGQPGVRTVLSAADARAAPDAAFLGMKKIIWHQGVAMQLRGFARTGAVPALMRRVCGVLERGRMRPGA
jgi:hypothetical protein